MTEPADPHLMQPGHAPTPFTAAEIRAGCSAGRRSLILAVSDTGAPELRLTAYVANDAESAEQELRTFSCDGTPLGDPVRRRSGWTDLQAHASFPADRTEIVAEEIDGPLGSLACLRYTVSGPDATTTYWFARTLPGMPIRVITTAGGRVASSLAVVADSLVPSSPAG